MGLPEYLQSPINGIVEQMNLYKSEPGYGEHEWPRKWSGTYIPQGTFKKLVGQQVLGFIVKMPTSPIRVPRLYSWLWPDSVRVTVDCGRWQMTPVFGSQLPKEAAHPMSFQPSPVLVVVGTWSPSAARSPKLVSPHWWRVCVGAGEVCRRHYNTPCVASK